MHFPSGLARAIRPTTHLPFSIDTCSASHKVNRYQGKLLAIRRALISRVNLTQTLEYSDILTHNYDYSRVLRSCVVTSISIPLGIAGPLNIDGELVHIPMATAGGTLIASTSAVLTNDAVTHGPAIDFPSIVMAAEVKLWIDLEVLPVRRRYLPNAHSMRPP